MVASLGACRSHSRTCRPGKKQKTGNRQSKPYSVAQDASLYDDHSSATLCCCIYLGAPTGRNAIAENGYSCVPHHPSNSWRIDLCFQVFSACPHADAYSTSSTRIQKTRDSQLPGNSHFFGKKAKITMSYTPTRNTAYRIQLRIVPQKPRSP